MVVDKRAGLVMHPAPGHRRGTLMNGLLGRYPELAGVPRAGIVHRLDRDTSGLCTVARTPEAHTALVRELQARAMRREYLAVAIGEPPASGTVDAPIGRDGRDRKRMAVAAGGKPAVTHFEVLERLAGAALLAVRLETGRTHQIRVHARASGHPVAGDERYGDARANAALRRCGVARLCLHARAIGFPWRGRPVRVEVAPDDAWRTTLAALRRG